MGGHRELLLVAAIGLLAGCGSEGSERMAGYVLVGSALGVPGGPIGVVVGAGVGAAASVIIPPSADGSQRDARN